MKIKISHTSITFTYRHARAHVHSPFFPSLHTRTHVNQKIKRTFGQNFTHLFGNLQLFNLGQIFPGFHKFATILTNQSSELLITEVFFKRLIADMNCNHCFDSFNLQRTLEKIILSTHLQKLK